MLATGRVYRAVFHVTKLPEALKGWGQVRRGCEGRLKGRQRGKLSFQNCSAKSHAILVSAYWGYTVLVSPVDPSPRPFVWLRVAQSPPGSFCSSVRTGVEFYAEVESAVENLD